MFENLKKTLGGALLIAGTAIGAGMLALPVTTALGGFIPSCIVYLLCWLFTMATGLLLFEVCLWMPAHANIITMAGTLLGKKGKIISWILYLFLFYCLTVAYIAGGGGLIRALVGGTLPSWLAIILFTLIFSPVVYAGTFAVDRFNLILMAGLCISYIMFVVIGATQIRPEFLLKGAWPKALLALPVIFASFSYQGIIPSLTNYLKHNVLFIRKAIIIGSSIPFVIYVIWELLILGIVPVEGPFGLLAANQEGLTAVVPLKHFVESPQVYAIGQAFAFFALTTSFLGVTLGLTDFLADGLKMVKKGANKLILYAIVFLPPMLIALLNPHIFIQALSYAGGVGCALLLGLLPVWMVWVGRYQRGMDPITVQLKGGKMLLIVLALFVFFEIVIEIFNELSRAFG